MCDSAVAKPVSPAPPSQSDKSELEHACAFIKETDDQARLEAFIRQFGDTAYVPMARQRLEELKKRQVVIAAPLSPAAQSQEGYAMAACRLTRGVLADQWTPLG